MEQMLKAPSFQPKLKSSIGHGIGLLILFSIPLLALFGIFGRTEGSIESALGTEIGISGTYPTRSRVGHTEHFNIVVENRSGMVKDVELSFEKKYLDLFSDVSFIPEVDRPYVIELKEIGPRSTKIARVKIKAGRMGKHKSQLVIKSVGGGEVRVPLETWVFP